MLKKYKIGSVLVNHEKRYVGILTEADICRKGVAKGIRHLAVTENTTIVGILSVADLVRYYSGVE